jgi:type II secretory pathway pseudopilin PulG
MMNKAAFTIIELIIALVMLTALTATVLFLHNMSFKVWGAAKARSDVRIEMAQALELMTRDVQSATALDEVAQRSLKFTADLGDPAGALKQYRFHLAKVNGETSYTLLRGLGVDPDGNGVIMVSGLSDASGFSVSGKLVTVDLTAVHDGATVHMRTNIRPRNW